MTESSKADEACRNIVFSDYEPIQDYAPAIPALLEPACPSEPIMRVDSNRSAERGDYYQNGSTPDYFTASQMNARWLDGYAAGRAAAGVQGGADRASGVPARESDRQLMRFYGVESLQALIDAQERHIAKLQAKIPPLRDEMPRNPRIG